MINVQEVKEKILVYLRESGPSLPVPIAKSLGLETMLVSAILSELFNEKKVRLSYMRVGSSPLYFVPEDYPKLESFSDNLHGVEKEAFNKLKEERVLVDEELSPAERVALRHLKDFAHSFNSEGKAIWRYFLVEERDAKDMLDKGRILADKVLADVSSKLLEKPVQKQIETIRDVSEAVWKDIEKEKYKEDIREKVSRMAKEIEEKQKQLEEARQLILDKVAYHERVVLQTPEKEIIEKRGKKPDKKQVFLEEVKRHIFDNGMELISVEGLKPGEILIKARANSEPNRIFLVVAWDKKKVGEQDIVKAYKKAGKLNLPFYLISRGELSKKLRENIEACRNLINSGTLA